MTFRRTAVATAILSLYSAPGLVHAQADQTNNAHASDIAMADGRVQVLPTVQVEGEAIDPYKVDDAQSPKFTAPLLDTPKSFTVISEELLRDTAATSLQDALRQVPGITFAAGEGGQPIADRPIIRGINSTSNVFVDGMRDIGSQTREVFDLEAVEVLKGSDSVYAGRGSGGGSVNLVSKTAKGEDFTRGTLMFGTADTLRGTIDQNWVINDTVAFRLGVLGAKGGTPGRDSAVDFDKWGVSPSLAFGLGTPTRVTLDYYHLSDNSMPDYSIPYDLETGVPATETLGVDADSFYGLVNRDFREGETDIATVFVDHDLENGLHLRNATRWGKSTNSYVVSNPDDSAGNVANGSVYRSTKNRWSQTKTIANQTDLTGRLVTGFLEHSFDFGVEFTREKKEQDGYTITSANPHVDADGNATRNCDDPVLDPTQPSYDCTDLYNPNPYDPWAGTVARNDNPSFYQTDATAIYAFDTIKFSEQWQASLGVRWDRYETEAETPSDPAANAHSSDTFINYQLGLVYKPVSSGSIYASYGTETTPAPLGSGDEDAPFPGSPDDCTRRCRADNTNIDPEETENFEIGAKWELFNERLLLTAAIFDISRENAYIEVEPDVFDTAGETSVRGAEFSFSGSISEKWKVFGGYSYLDSELVRAATGSVAEGKELPNTPEHSFTLFTNYAITPAITVGGGANYVSEVYGSLTSDPVKKIPDYWRFDAMASWALMPDLELQLNVQNITDEVYYTKAYAAHYAALGSGRQVLVSANFSF